jgi:hypothetical protein
VKRISKFWRILQHRSRLVRSNHQLFAAFHITLWCCVLVNKCLETRKMWQSYVRFASLRTWRCVFRLVAPDVSKERGDLMVFALLGCYSAYVGSGLPTFCDNVLVTSSRVKQRKKNTARLTTQRRRFAHLNIKQHSTVNPWLQFIVHVSVSLSYFVLKCCAKCFDCLLSAWRHATASTNKPVILFKETFQLHRRYYYHVDQNTA